MIRLVATGTVLGVVSLVIGAFALSAIYTVFAVLVTDDPGALEVVVHYWLYLAVMMLFRAGPGPLAAAIGVAVTWLALLRAAQRAAHA